jgi:hypothetical protein
MPHGRPQYGVFEVDSVNGDGTARLVNVRQTQYLSNGDHVRMISKALSPENFILRARFTVEDLAAEEDTTVNTWIRLAYDFDPTWDPGHDWFGFYASFEWKRIGLLTVRPVERFYLQDQEPKQGLDPIPGVRLRRGKNV